MTSKTPTTEPYPVRMTKFGVLDRLHVDDKKEDFRCGRCRCRRDQLGAWIPDGLKVGYDPHGIQEYLDKANPMHLSKWCLRCARKLSTGRRGLPVISFHLGFALFSFAFSVFVVFGNIFGWFK